MKLRVLHLEDSVTKHTSIVRVINSVTIAEIDWVTDAASGIEKIEKAIEQEVPYDLAITDMHYPLSRGIKADWEAGEFFVDVIKNIKIDLPVIICSTHNIRNSNAIGCVWYNSNRDWESELEELVKYLLIRKTERYCRK